MVGGGEAARRLPRSGSSGRRVFPRLRRPVDDGRLDVDDGQRRFEFELEFERAVHDVVLVGDGRLDHDDGGILLIGHHREACGHVRP